MGNLISKNKATIVAFMAAFGTTFTSPLLANTNPTEPSAVEVKYLGTVQKNPVFEVNLTNEAGESFIVRVLDASGRVLYKEKLEGKNISRKYRIATEEELESDSIRFEIRTVNSNKTEVYSVGVNENFTREMAVNKLY